MLLTYADFSVKGLGIEEMLGEVPEKLLYKEYPCSKCGIGPYTLDTLV